MTKKKVLVCGASGFIGRNMFEYLSKRSDLEVYGVYNTNKFSSSQNLMQANLTNREDVKRITRGMDIIIHAAAITTGAKDVVERPYIHITDNLIINALLNQAAFDNSVSQFIFFSCTVMYPTSDKALKETNLDLNQPMYEKYFGAGWMKVYIEKLCEFYSRLGRTKYTILRHSNIYGPYDKFDPEKSHVLAATILKVMNAKDNAITVWGEGKEARDLLYISDLINLVECIIDKQDYAFGLFNAGFGEAISVDTLVKKVIEISGKNLIIQYDKTKPTIATKIFLDTTKAKGKFGWEPKVGLEEGIRKTIEWYKKNLAEG